MGAIFETVLGLIWEIVWQVVLAWIFHWIGYGTLKALTLGKYPAADSDGRAATGFGAFVFAAAMGLIAWLTTGS